MISSSVIQSVPNRVSVSSCSSSSKPKRVSYPQFAEIVNMRAAMGGTFAGIANEIITGKTIPDQLSDPSCMLAAAAFTGLVAVGSVVSINERVISDFDNEAPFTPDAEKVNGRVAMIGALGMALTPYILNH